MINMINLQFFNFQSPKMSLLKMPPELLAHICFSLPLSSIAALERTCKALHSGISHSGIFCILNGGLLNPSLNLWMLPYINSSSPGIWATRARKVDRAKSYNYVTRALADVKQKNVTDQKVFKVKKSESISL